MCFGYKTGAKNRKLASTGHASIWISPSSGELKADCLWGVPLRVALSVPTPYRPLLCMSTDWLRVSPRRHRGGLRGIHCYRSRGDHPGRPGSCPYEPGIPVMVRENTNHGEEHAVNFAAPPGRRSSEAQHFPTIKLLSQR